MKITLLAIAAAALPGTAWAKLETSGRLRAARALEEDGLSMEAGSIALMDTGEMGAKSGKMSKASKATKIVDSLCPTEYPSFDRSEPFQPLIVPEQIYPDEDGVTRVDLIWQPAEYIGPAYTTLVRNFGSTPGPTIHVAPGGSLELRHVNCMYPPIGFMGPEAHNRYHHPNSTNLHTHGPHISGENPGDNVFVKTGPRSYHDYHYEFGKNHMPGTFWYHPHLHGSTAVQTGAGSSGMLIMDEPEDYDIPAAIKDMEDIQIVFQHMNLKNLREASRVSQDELTDWSTFNYEVTNKTTDLTNIMLANMQFLPKITMDAGKWYRWRMVMSSIQVGVAFQGSENCEMKLLAKDGIFLDDAPRDVSVVILSAGNRADVAVRCHEPGHEFMNSTEVNIPAGSGAFDPGNQYPIESDGLTVENMAGTFTDPKEQPTILVIDVVSTELEKFTAPKPCYLVDLRDVPEEEIQTSFTIDYGCVNELGGYPFTNFPNGWPFRQTEMDICGVTGPYGKGGVWSDGPDIAPFTPWVDEDTYINDFPTGTVNEIVHVANAFHPYHQHINSFQLVEIADFDKLQDFVANWYQIGDWQDTTQIPARGLEGNGIVRARFQADQFSGHMVQHCHLLFHEDQGMMAQYNVTGVEGAIWHGAREIDPQCILPY